MKQYTYKLETPAMWSSFDYGEVEADNIEEAIVKAKEEIKYNFDKVNDVLNYAEITQGFTISYDEAQLEVTEKK